MIENVSTIVFCQKGLNSVKLADVIPVEAFEEPMRQAVNKKLEFCHFVKADTIVMPDFYKASINMCGKFDYAFCHCASLPEGKILKHPTPNNFNISQIIIKTWVINELGVAGDDIENLINKVLTEYRGIEIPHVMTVEVGK